MTFLSEPMPFEEAIQANAIKQLLPTTLSSKEIAALSSDLKRRARFSATVTDLGHLDRLDGLITKIAGGPDAEDFAARARGEKPLLVSIPEAKAQLLEYLKSVGYQPNEGEHGSIKDLSSDRRLNLIVETNVLDAQGFGRWKATQNPASLDAFPAWELTRVKFSKVPRDWADRWGEALSECEETDGATPPSDERMVALKNHEIWERLGDPEIFDDALGNPWPPFAFNSGMNVIDVRRDDAVEIGLLDADEDVAPASDDRGLNDNLEASVANFGTALMRALAGDPLLKIKDGILTVHNTAVARDRIAGLLAATQMQAVRNRAAQLLQTLGGRP